MTLIDHVISCCAPFLLMGFYLPVYGDSFSESSHDFFNNILQFIKK